MTDGPDDDDRVGYGRPPRRHRFKKGAPSPNPQGRPRTSKAPDAVGKVLDQRVPMTVNGRREKVTVTEALLQSMLKDAFSGDRRARHELFILLAQREADQRNIRQDVQRKRYSIIFSTYHGDALQQLGVCESHHYDHLISTWVVEAAIQRLSPEEIDAIDWDRIAPSCAEPEFLYVLLGRSPPSHPPND